MAERRTLEQRDRAAIEARIRARYSQFADWHDSIVRLHPDLDDEDAARLPNMYDTMKVWKPVILRGGNDLRGPLDAAAVLGEQFLAPFVIDRLLAYGRRAMRSLAGALEQFDARHRDAAGRLRPSKRARRHGKARVKDEDGLARAREPWIEDWMWDPEEVLLRPTALFVCTECGAHPYAYPEINVHW